jgi:hypothetical protein
MGGCRADSLHGLRGVGQIDAAELDPVGRRRCACRGGKVNRGHAGAACEGGAYDNLAKRAGGSGDDDDLSVHEGLSSLE